MGGDSFEGTEKLTNEQFQILVPQILEKLKELFIRAQPYIPLPEKLIHGDIDILMILKPGVTGKDVIQQLNIQQFIINNNHTINSVYKNKQVDFCFKENDQQYQITKFYKSYSGMGAHLGIFLPSKEIKLSDQGLFAVGFKQHIKFQFLITRDVRQILQFYGLDCQTYFKGFKTRKCLFQYLRNCCFMNQSKLTKYQQKGNCKLTNFFIEYLKQQENIKEEQKKQYKQVQKQTLAYFNKQFEYTKQFHLLLQQVERKRNLNKKFNGMHIMEHFGLQSKRVNKIKQQFRNSFKCREQYEQFIEDNSLETIFDKLVEVTGIVKQEHNQQKPIKMVERGEKGEKKRRKKKRPEQADQNNQVQQTEQNENKAKVQVKSQE